MSIFKDNLDVSFAELAQNLAKRGKSRYLEQFRNSPVLQQIVDAISFETQTAYDAGLNVLKGRTLGTGEDGYAEGVQLDKIGYLIGQARVVANSKPIDFFTPFFVKKSPDEQGAPEKYGDPKFAVDVAQVWVKNGRLFEEEQLLDDMYYRLILAKIFKNHIRGASLPDVRLAGSYIYGHLVTLVKTGLQHYQIGFLSTSNVDGEPSVDESSLNAMYLVRVAWNDTRVDDYYALPVPPTVLIDTDNIFIFPKADGTGEVPDAFIPDIDPAGKTDFSKVAIKVNIGGIL